MVQIAFASTLCVGFDVKDLGAHSAGETAFILHYRQAKDQGISTPRSGHIQGGSIPGNLTQEASVPETHEATSNNLSMSKLTAHRMQLHYLC